MERTCSPSRVDHHQGGKTIRVGAPESVPVLQKVTNYVSNWLIVSGFIFCSQLIFTDNPYFHAFQKKAIRILFVCLSVLLGL